MCTRERDLPRIDDDAHLAVALVGGEDPLAALQHDLGEVPAARTPAQQVRSRERGHERVARARHELGRRRELAQASVDEHADLVRERRRVLVVVRDEQRGEGEVAQQLVQLAAHLRLRMRVERSERLVEQQHRRVPREGPGERDALTLAAGELSGTRVCEVRDPEPLEQVADGAGVGHVRTNAHVREKRIVLEDEADAPLLRRQSAPRRAVERHASARRLQQTGDDAQHRRLARSRRPHERDGALDGERQLEVESAKRNAEVEEEASHLRVRSSSALTSTSNPPSARAVWKSTANSA